MCDRGVRAVVSGQLCTRMDMAEAQTSSNMISIWMVRAR